MGDVANTDNPTFALSDFDSVYGKKLVLVSVIYFAFMRLINQIKKIKPTSNKK
jgi:hypothetical protein